MHKQRITQPVGQVLMTNVAVVRLRRGGKRFEIACYKNKVVNWRNGVETDIDEVLQIAKVYENVSKGKFAKKSDWMTAFGVSDEEEACRIILEHGELQVAQGERKAQVENLYRDIATIVADKCVNPDSNRPYPFSVIERVMKDIHYAVVPNRSAKQQALDVIKKLQEHIPIARAKMKVKITASAAAAKKIKEESTKHDGTEVVEEVYGDPSRLVLLIFPGSFRVMDTLVQEHSKGSGTLEVIELSCHQEGEHSIDDEIAKKTERLGIHTDTPGNGRGNAGATKMTTPTSGSSGSKGKQCSTCGGDFGQDVKMYREHFRSEWHRFNLKRKSMKMSILDEAAFMALDPKEVQDFFSKLTE